MNRMHRFLRRAAVTAATAAAVVAASAVPATALPELPHPGPVLKQPDGFCSYGYWQGRFFCDSQDLWIKPDNFAQVFVVGPDHNVYTRWANREGTYDWLNMGGNCRGNPGIAVRSVKGDWGVKINCKGGPDNEWYHRERLDDGRWTGWKFGFGHAS